MLVWKAISSIVLMIFETRWLDSRTLAMVATIWPIERLASVTRSDTVAISAAAWSACSAVVRAIEPISSVDADVSSSVAACSLAAWASEPADADTLSAVGHDLAGAAAQAGGDLPHLARRADADAPPQEHAG